MRSIDNAAIEVAAEALRRGELVMLPTETVYGLAADASNALAVAKIFAAKGRPSFNPLIAHVANQAGAEAIAAFDDRAAALVRGFWPGPLTLVLPALETSKVCDLARGGLATVAVRAPGHPLALALIAAFGGALAAPSANRSTRPSPTTLADALSETGGAVTAALDGGPCEVGLESTVVSLLPGEPARMLRPGGACREDIEAICGPLADAGEGIARSPGRLTLHYAPKAPVRLNVEVPAPDEAYLAFGGGASAGRNVFNLSSSGDLTEAAANLFSHLRAADKLDLKAIAVAPIPQRGIGEAINDRLVRAAGHRG